MPISKKTKEKACSRNKQIARKIASKLNLKHCILPVSTGTVYLYLRYKFSTTIRSNKQTIVRISNHPGNDTRGFDVDVVVFRDEDPVDFFDDAIDRITQHIVSNGGRLES